MTGPHYQLRFRPAALRQLRKLDSQIARRIKSTTETLRTEPRPPGVKALTGQRGWLRIRGPDLDELAESLLSDEVVAVFPLVAAALVPVSAELRTARPSEAGAVAPARLSRPAVAVDLATQA